MKKPPEGAKVVRQFQVWTLKPLLILQIGAFGQECKANKSALSGRATASAILRVRVSGRLTPRRRKPKAKRLRASGPAKVAVAKGSAARAARRSSGRASVVA